MRTLSIVRGASIAASILVLATAAQAGGQTHVMHSAIPHDAYILKLAAAPQVGQPLVVSVVDETTGQTVGNANVVVLRPMIHNSKHVPMIEYVSERLASDGSGHFVCAGAHHKAGQMLTLRAHVPDNGADLWATAQVQG